MKKTKKIKRGFVTFDESAKEFCFEALGYRNVKGWLVDEKGKKWMKYKDCCGITKEGPVKGDIASLIELSDKMED